LYQVFERPIASRVAQAAVYGLVADQGILCYRHGESFLQIYESFYCCAKRLRTPYFTLHPETETKQQKLFENDPHGGNKLGSTSDHFSFSTIHGTTNKLKKQTHNEKYLHLHESHFYHRGR
jgi:hypothetical protein